MNEREFGTDDQAPGLPKDGVVPDEARSTSREQPRGDASVGYRIAAMVAMFLLALASMLFWYFGR
jgi:hypothetical protein